MYDPNLVELEDNPSNDPIETTEEDPVDSSGMQVYKDPFIDMLIHTEVLNPQGEYLK